MGRHEELDLLAGLLGRAATGEGGAALVIGEAGVGKSRLVVEFARRARRAGALAAGGRVRRPRSRPSFRTRRSSARFAPSCVSAPSPSCHRLLGAARAELARLLPELGDPAPAAAGGQARLFELLLGVLSRLGREQPVLLVFEDVHWADARDLDLSASSCAISAPSGLRSC